MNPKNMNKIVLHISLLIFCFSIIFFVQREMQITDVIIKSFLIFFAATIILSVAAIIAARLIQKSKDNSMESDSVLGSTSNE